MFTQLPRKCKAYEYLFNFLMAITEEMETLGGFQGIGNLGELLCG
jgi:hypothetical protein